MDQNQRAAEVENLAAREAVADRRVASASNDILTVSFGKKVSYEEFFGVAAFDFHENPWMADPKRYLLAHPNPTSEYGWPKLKDAATSQKIRQGFFRVVHEEELRPEHAAPLTTHKGVNGSWVMWYGHVLVEVPEAAYRAMYLAPIARGQRRLLGIGESFQDRVERESGGKAVGTFTETRGGTGADPGAEPEL